LSSKLRLSTELLLAGKLRLSTKLLLAGKLWLSTKLLLLLWWQLTRRELRIGGLAWQTPMHRHTVSVHSGQGRPAGNRRVAVAHRRHPGNVGVGVAGGQLTTLHHLPDTRLDGPIR
jgi:hypothetical protein